MSHYICRICNSDSREEIEQLLNQRLQYREIAKTYLDSFDCDLHLLEQSIAGHKKHIPKKLTQQEDELLGKLEKGEVGIDEMSRIVAVKVFDKMLKNPDDFRFIDFFRTELLKLKAEENKVKDDWSKEIIARMFSGHLPPRECPHCGKNVLNTHTLSS